MSGVVIRYEKILTGRYVLAGRVTLSRALQLSSASHMYAKSAVTIANILEAAASLFIARNFADVTMSDIAGAADVTKGALYHHFDSKEDLYLTMMHAYLEEIKSLVAPVVAADSPARERLRTFTLTFLRLPPEKQALMQLVRRDVNIFEGGERRRLVSAYQDALPVQAEKIIQEGIDNGEIIVADARLLAWEHVASVEVLMADYARDRLGGPEAMANFVIDLFFDGVAQHQIS